MFLDITVCADCSNLHRAKPPIRSCSRAAGADQLVRPPLPCLPEPQRLQQRSDTELKRHVDTTPCLQLSAWQPGLGAALVPASPSRSQRSGPHTHWCLYIGLGAFSWARRALSPVSASASLLAKDDIPREPPPRPAEQT